jgi:anti-sigma regulatory factor (Ser/Thr protein kinase)
MTRPDFSLVFPPDPAWVRSARDLVRTLLTTSQRQDIADTALLLTSEVVTNAINACHASDCQTPITLLAEWVRPSEPGNALRVLVHDEARGLPNPRAATLDEEDGRGLDLIRGCASDWGVSGIQPGPGKIVWFECASATPSERA